MIEDKEDQILKAALELNKELLNGISVERLIEIEKQILTQPELENRAAEAEIFYRNHFEDVLALFILQALRYLGETAENNQMLLFGRGEINAYKKIAQWFKEQSGFKELLKEKDEVEETVDNRGS